MRELLLLRHAEAAPATPGGDDIDRSLTMRGKAQAMAVGEWIAGNDLFPDVVLCSTATRARMTATIVLDASRTTGDTPVIYQDVIYSASPGQLVAALDGLDTTPERVLLVGHNPGLERLLALLCHGRSDGFRGMPSCALAQVRLHDSLEPGSGSLIALHTP